MDLSRRNVGKAIALGISSCLVHEVYAEASPDGKPVPSPYRSVNVPGDKSNVIFFFDFTCPFCAKLHEPFISWSATVPKQVKVFMIPVVGNTDAGKMRDQVIAARCYFAAREVGTPDQLKQFVAAVYSNVANGVPISAQQGWMRAVQTAGMDIGKFGRSIGKSTQLDKIRDAGKQVLDYRLEATPSVAIGGKYVVTPDDVAGDPANFFTLVNGLTSRLLMG
jgi:protein dithiol oxidoreductase (disulfide-forming)